MIYQKPPIIDIKSPLFEGKNISLGVAREDLNHPLISGNKWWKLKYNLKKAVEEGHSTLLTFGGAYSNHLFATSAAANELGLKSIGIVRGEERLPLNRTLSFAKSCGMELHYVSREAYRNKTNPGFIQALAEKYGHFYCIPEGGTNLLAIKGCEEWAHALQTQTDFDYLCLPVGTGGTMAGMINGLGEKKIIGFSSLKGGDFLRDEIESWLKHTNRNWQIETHYHFGGYGKITKVLSQFISNFEKETSIPLDPVYTGKMMYGIYDRISKNTFAPGSRILALHTGGLQGRTNCESHFATL